MGVNRFQLVVADHRPPTEIKELADLGRALGTAEAGLIGVGEAGEGTVAQLDDHEVEHGDILGHDTPAARLAAALALAASVTLETRRLLGHEKKHARCGEHTLLHAETLLVVAAHDFEDVPLELIAETLALDLRGDALVVEDAKLGVVGDLHLLLATRGGVGNVELHDDDDDDGLCCGG